MAEVADAPFQHDSMGKASHSIHCNYDDDEPRTVCVSPFAPPAMQGLGIWNISDFDLGTQLYQGKTSQLFEAIHRNSGIVVALKLYKKKKLSILNRYQVEREIRIHISLQHSSIINLYAAFEDGDYVYMVQEFAGGGDLFENVRKMGGQMDERQAINNVLWPFLQGLEYLHSKNIIHRDIKPENMLLTKDGALKIADFGLSINSSEERPVTRAGTLDYMAPEVLVCPDKKYPSDNKDKLTLVYNHLVDTWAVGILAYEMLMGRPPFERDSRSATYEYIMYRDPKFPSWLPDDAKEFISLALCKDAKHRAGIDKLMNHPWIHRHLQSHKSSSDPASYTISLADPPTKSDLLSQKASNKLLHATTPTSPSSTSPTSSAKPAKPDPPTAAYLDLHSSTDSLGLIPAGQALDESEDACGCSEPSTATHSQFSCSFSPSTSLREKLTPDSAAPSRVLGWTMSSSTSNKGVTSTALTGAAAAAAAAVTTDSGQPSNLATSSQVTTANAVGLRSMSFNNSSPGNALDFRNSELSSTGDNLPTKMPTTAASSSPCLTALLTPAPRTPQELLLPGYNSNRSSCSSGTSILTCSSFSQGGLKGPLHGRLNALTPLIVTSSPDRTSRPPSVTNPSPSGATTPPGWSSSRSLPLTLSPAPKRTSGSYSRGLDPPNPITTNLHSHGTHMVSTKHSQERILESSTCSITAPAVHTPPVPLTLLNEHSNAWAPPTLPVPLSTDMSPSEQVDFAGHTVMTPHAHSRSPATHKSSHTHNSRSTSPSKASTGPTKSHHHSHTAYSQSRHTSHAHSSAHNAFSYASANHSHSPLSPSSASAASPHSRAPPMAGWEPSDLLHRKPAHLLPVPSRYPHTDEDKSTHTGSIPAHPMSSLNTVRTRAASPAMLNLGKPSSSSSSDTPASSPSNSRPGTSGMNLPGAPASGGVVPSAQGLTANLQGFNSSTLNNAGLAPTMHHAVGSGLYAGFGTGLTSSNNGHPPTGLSNIIPMGGAIPGARAYPGGGITPFPSSPGGIRPEDGLWAYSDSRTGVPEGQCSSDNMQPALDPLVYDTPNSQGPARLGMVTGAAMSMSVGGVLSPRTVARPKSVQQPRLRSEAYISTCPHDGNNGYRNDAPVKRPHTSAGITCGDGSGTGTASGITGGGSTARCVHVGGSGNGSTLRESKSFSSLDTSRGSSRTRRSGSVTFKEPPPSTRSRDTAVTNVPHRSTLPQPKRMGSAKLQSSISWSPSPSGSTPARSTSLKGSANCQASSKQKLNNSTSSHPPTGHTGYTTAGSDGVQVLTNQTSSNRLGTPTSGSGTSVYLAAGSSAHGNKRSQSVGPDIKAASHSRASLQRVDNATREAEHHSAKTYILDHFVGIGGSSPPGATSPQPMYGLKQQHCPAGLSTSVMGESPSAMTESMMIANRAASSKTHQGTGHRGYGMGLQSGVGNGMAQHHQPKERPRNHTVPPATNITALQQASVRTKSAPTTPNAQMRSMVPEWEDEWEHGAEQEGGSENLDFGRKAVTQGRPPGEGNRWLDTL